VKNEIGVTFGTINERNNKFFTNLKAKTSLRSLL